MVTYTHKRWAVIGHIHPQKVGSVLVTYTHKRWVVVTSYTVDLDAVFCKKKDTSICCHRNVSYLCIFISMIHASVNPLTATLRESGYLYIFCYMVPLFGCPDRMLTAKWCRFLWARLERYLQNGAVIWLPGFTHRPSV